MKPASWFKLSMFVVPLLLGAGLFLAELPGVRTLAEAIGRRLAGTTHSGPIAITPDDRLVWVVNPDNDNVAVLDVSSDAAELVARIEVGDEPQNVAISPDGRFAYVSNTVSGTVSVIRTRGGNKRVIETIVVGTEPYGLAFTPNGDKLYVANARSNTISVIDPKKNRVLRTIDGVGLEPRGIAITDDGDDDDTDERVFVTQFLGVDRPGVLIGRDDYKEGRVSVISAGTDDVIGEVVLSPLSDTGFRSNGSALDRIPATDPPTLVVTGAFPNMLNALAIKGNRAYLPNAAASSNGPVRFNVNVQAFLSVVDIENLTEGQAEGTRQTINMNRGINFEPAGENKIFLGVPWHIDFKHNSNVGYVVAAAANIVVKVDLDENGTPTIHAPTAPGDLGAIVRIKVGQNPRGIVINSRDDRAYVMNEVSRDVSIIDLTNHTVIATVPTEDLPDAGTLEATVQLGKAVFNSSTGVNLPSLGPNGVIGSRLSSEGWSGCFSCHPFGLTDGVVWIFGNGPRRTLSLNGTFNPEDPLDIKILNHSGIRDEVQDFELNIRAVSGGQGLIVLADGTTPDPMVANFVPPNAGRSVPLDAMTEYIARAVRSPISPLAGNAGSFVFVDPDIERGRELFAAANCASCHGGQGWSSSRRDFTPPPPPDRIVAGQIVSLLRNVGTFDPAAANEIRDNGAPALGAAGFVPPSLLGDFALGPYLHHGAAITLTDVMELVTHRASGTGAVDILSDPADRAKLVKFLVSIDASTEPFAIAATRPLEYSLDVGNRLAAADTRLRLEGFWPNPSRGAGTTLAFVLPAEGKVRLALYDARGRVIMTLVDGIRAAGRHELTWDGRDASGHQVPPGVYFARLMTDTALETGRLVKAW